MGSISFLFKTSEPEDINERLAGKLTGKSPKEPIPTEQAFVSVPISPKLLKHWHFTYFGHLKDYILVAILPFSHRFGKRTVWYWKNLKNIYNRPIWMLRMGQCATTLMRVVLPQGSALPVLWRAPGKLQTIHK